MAVGGHAARMRIPFAALAWLLLTGCGGGPSDPEARRALPALDGEAFAAAIGVERAGCARCHALAPLGEDTAVPADGPALAAAAGWYAAGLEDFLAVHHGGAAAADLAAWVRSLATPGGGLQPADVAPPQLARGERSFRELACGACHAPAALEGLASRTDLAHVRDFLIAPAAHRPAVPHDFALQPAEAEALAAWLLRAQAAASAAPVPGFGFECFEIPVETAAQPSLEGREPSARGVVARLDVSPRTRDDHFVLRFRTTLDVPATGEWTFTTGSDDSSWLWIDGELVVRNEALAPHRRRAGAVQLTAGPHELEVLYAEAAGEQSLEVLWRGPGVDEQEIPTAAASAVRLRLQPPGGLPPPDAAAVARGRTAAAQKRCVACHTVEDPHLAALPAPPPARPFAALGGGQCPESPHAQALVLPRQALAQRPFGAADALALALRADGCEACHARDGRGGLPPAVRNGLTEQEDLGDEGRLPPDLTRAGHRLRPAWIERLLAGDVRARPYLRVRMPKLAPARAQQYARWFAAVDGGGGDDREPPFAADAVLQGARLAGIGGRNCVTCHSFAGRRALGPQGMDLAIQHERLRPGWFREWVLAPTKHRPGTRMAPAFLDDGPAARAEVDAIRTWLSLGAGAPLPTGLDRSDGLVLAAQDRPILHGAFLQGLSARCIAVGSPLRAHYAFDVEHGRLAWLWRGDFVDASGTWSGRAGQLLQPRSDDRIVLADFGLAGERRVLGRREGPDGHPVFRVAVGDSEYEDHTAPRLHEAGAEFVRTLRCVRGEVAFDFAPQRAAQLTVLAPEDSVRLAAGQQVEVIYRW